MNSTCDFVRSWAGPCGKPAGASGKCPEHADMRCVSCGEPATRDCEHTGIQFVCGAPLCDNCGHSAPPLDNPGMFMLGGGHAPKVEADAAWEAYWAAKYPEASTTTNSGDLQ